ncbi:hypothetical protein IMSAG185_01920 [Lachnospiraceae bacterium]|nr:hypothetical protein IMSAG185_01920 [Lachnospiraceae bacterium]
MGSELLRIAEGFSIVAEGLRGLAKAEGGTKEKTVKAQKAEKQESVAEVQQESPATLEGIRALMAQKTQEGKSKEIKELLQKYGAAKLSAVKPEDYLFTDHHNRTPAGQNPLLLRRCADLRGKGAGDDGKLERAVRGSHLRIHRNAGGNGLGEIECRIHLVEIADETFKDGGHAMQWAIGRA